MESVASAGASPVSGEASAGAGTTTTVASAGAKGTQASAGVGAQTGLAASAGENREWAASVEADRQSRTIVRATTKFAFESWRVAQDGVAHRARTCAADCKACILQKSLREVRDECVAAVNMALRMHYTADSKSLDEIFATGGGRPRTGKAWPAADVYAYPALVKAFPDVATGIMALLTRRARQRWTQDRWDCLVWNKKAPSHFRTSMPLPIRAQEVRLAATDDPDTFMFAFSLHAAASPKRVRNDSRQPEFVVPVHSHDARQRRELANIASGKWRVGDAMIEQDRLRPSRWHLRISYTALVETLPHESKKTAAINRGMTVFLAAVTGDGDDWLYEGQDIIAYLKQIQARRRQYQYASKASGRDGRGRNHMLAPLKKLEDAGGRWRDTKCHTIARRLVDWLVDRGVTDLVMEDFTGIRDEPPEKLEGGKYVWDLIQEWPYYQLQTMIKSNCELASINVVIRPAQYISQTCAKCGHVAPENIQLARRKFECVSCGHKKHLDVNAATNMLRRLEDAPTVASVGGGPKGKKRR